MWSFGGHQVPPYGVDVTRYCAQWARDRQAALGPSVSLSQVAVLDSETAWRKGGESGQGGRVHSLARALAEAHYLTDIVNEQTFREARGRYSVLLVPEHREVAPETLAALREFAGAGGLVLLTGGALRGGGEEPAAVAALLGLKRTAPADNRPAVLVAGKVKQFLPGAWQVEAGAARVLAPFADGRPALAANPVGKGTVAYLATSALQYPDDGLAAWLLRSLGKGSSYEVAGGAGEAAVLCTLRGKPGQTVLHVVDLSARAGGAQVDVDTSEYTDFSPPLNGVRVTLPWPAAPARVRAVPTGTVARAEWQDGRLSVTIETMHTHAAVLLEGEAKTPLALLPAETPAPRAAFHVPDDRLGVLFADNFEAGKPGAPPAGTWAAENRGGTAIVVDESTAAAGRRALKMVEVADSSFWPFLHRSVPPFRRGRARLAFDFRVEPGTEFMAEARYEGKGAGPSVRVDGEGNVQAAGKTLTTVAPGAWHQMVVEFALGTERPAYSLSIASPGKEARTFADLPYASEWFFRCDSVYFVGSGQKPGAFFLDNIVFERLAE